MATIRTLTSGGLCVGENALFSEIAIRYTEDNHGKTLSLADERNEIQITVAFEEVERAIRTLRGTKK